MIKDELGDDRVSVACIGTAGEKLIKYACIDRIITYLNVASGSCFKLVDQKFACLTRGKSVTKQIDIAAVLDE